MLQLAAPEVLQVVSISSLAAVGQNSVRTVDFDSAIVLSEHSAAAVVGQVVVPDVVEARAYPACNHSSSVDCTAVWVWQVDLSEPVHWCHSKQFS